MTTNAHSMNRIETYVYALCRVMLIATVSALGYAAASAILDFGGLVIIGIIVLLLAAISRRRGAAFTAFGTARWADANDLRAAINKTAETSGSTKRARGNGQSVATKAAAPRSPRARR